MSRILFFLFLFSLSIPAGAQKANRFANQFKLSLFRTIELVNPGVELQYERSLNKHLSAALIYGYMRPFMINPLDFKGHRYGFELRHFTNPDQKVKTYLSAEAVHNNSRSEQEEGPYQDPSGNRIEPDTYFIHKKTTSLNLKCGNQYILGRFMVDVSFGMGVKYRDVKHTDRDHPVPAKYWDFYSNSKKEQNDWTVNLPMSMKLGFLF